MPLAFTQEDFLVYPMIFFLIIKDLFFILTQFTNRNYENNKTKFTHIFRIMYIFDWNILFGTRNISTS